MESEDGSDILYRGGPTNVIIVPTSPAEYGYKQRRSRCSSPRHNSPQRRCSASPGKTVLVGSSRYEPANYLTRGGERARDKANEEKLMKLNKAAMKELQFANSTLAQQLVRLQTEGGEERQAMRDEMVKLELLLQAQHDKMEVLEQRLAKAVKQNSEAEQKHHIRLKEIARRLKEEHLSKLQPLQEAHDELLAQLSAKQEDCRDMQQLREQLRKVTSRLEMESSSRADLWQKCTSLDKELKAAQDRLETCRNKLKQAELQLDHLLGVEEQLNDVRASLQSERVEHSKLQADAALDRSTAATLQVEVDHLRQQLATMLRQAEQSDNERSSLKLSLAAAQSASADAAVELRAANAKAARLEQELNMFRDEADKQIASVRTQSAAREERISAQAASRLAQMQSDLDAKGAAAAEAEAALSALRAEAGRLLGQVEALKRSHEAANVQLAASQDQVQQLEEQVTDLQGQLKATKATNIKQEAAVSELLVRQKASNQGWQQEKQQLQESLSNWRQKAVDLQKELEDRADQAVTTTQEHAHEVSKLQVALENSQAELEKIRSKLAAVEEERTAAAKRSRDLLTQWEERDRTQGQDLSVLRSKLSELLAENDAARYEAEQYKQQLRVKQQELETSTISLADEQARVAALRDQLGAIEKEKSAEVEARLKGMHELSAALHAEQQARLDAQLELNRSKKKQSAMEAQLQQSRIQALSQVLEAKANPDEAADAAAAQAAADRKAKQYRREDLNMLSDYESWVQGLLAKKAAGTAATSPKNISPVAGLASLSSPRVLKSPAGLSPRGLAEDSTLRSSSLTASPRQLSTAPGELDKYDRLAAVLESRGLGTDSLTRSLSAKSLSATIAKTNISPTSPRAPLSNRPAFR